MSRGMWALRQVPLTESTDPSQLLPHLYNSVLRGFAASCSVHLPGSISLHSAEDKKDETSLVLPKVSTAMHSILSLTDTKPQATLLEFHSPKNHK